MACDTNSRLVSAFEDKILRGSHPNFDSVRRVANGSFGGFVDLLWDWRQRRMCQGPEGNLGACSISIHWKPLLDRGVAVAQMVVTTV